MHKLIESTFQGMLKGFALGQKLEKSSSIDEKVIFNQIKEIIELGAFTLQIEAFDRWISKQNELKTIEPLLFDVFMINHFIEQEGEVDEAYFNSKEWEQIEALSSDRGCELMTMLNYIQECKDEEIDPDLSDFLNEYLMTDEDGFQEDAEVYESMISHQILMESTYKEIGRIASQLNTEDVLKEEFYPFMAWFYDQNPAENAIAELMNAAPNKAFSGACLFAILAFYKFK